MAKWTAEDRKTVLGAKKHNKYWNWDKIAATIDFRQSPKECRAMYMNRNPPTRTRVIPHKRVREESPPWSLQQRRRMSKLRSREPPTSWKQISEDITNSIHDYHPPESCQKYYEDMMPEREKNRGASDAMSEGGIRKWDQRTRKRDRAWRRGLKKTWTSQRWLPEDEDELIELCTVRQLPWEEIAEKMKRSVSSCQAKWRQLEPLHRIASNKQSKGKVVKDQNKRASGGNKIPKKKNGEASSAASAASSARSSPVVGASVGA